MKRRLRLRFRLATLLLAIGALCVLLVVNTRPHSHQLLGHVSFSADSPGFPGLWISGWDYGWPWSYRTESYQYEGVPFTGFDRFYGWGLCGDIVVGFVILAAVAALSQYLAILWASPYTLLGLGIGLAGLCTGGRARRRGRVLEFYGGAVTWLVTRLPGGQLNLAFTLGHTILGQTDASLDISRAHEMVHVRQFERWGPLMGPAYLMCSLVLWLSGRRPYRDNPFERQAYGETGDD